VSARDDYPVLAAHEEFGSAQFGQALDEIDRLRDVIGPGMTMDELRAEVARRRAGGPA